MNSRPFHLSCTCVEFTFSTSNSSQSSDQFQKHPFCPQSCCTDMQLPKNAKRRVFQKTIPLVVEKRVKQKYDHTHPGKRRRTKNVQIHLQMRSMQPVSFENNQSSSSSSPNPCKIQKRRKTWHPRCYSTIQQQIQGSAHVHHINGNLYFHNPFCYDSHAVQPIKFPTCNTM